jgi:hypothetical protein
MKIPMPDLDPASCHSSADHLVAQSTMSHGDFARSLSLGNIQHSLRSLLATLDTRKMPCIVPNELFFLEKYSTTAFTSILPVTPSPLLGICRVTTGQRGSGAPPFKDVCRSLEEVLRIAGCPNCGLVGLDLRFGLDQVLPPGSGVPATGTLEGGIAQGH